jgi:thiol:disulfide interchange protein DsbC
MKFIKGAAAALLLALGVTAAVHANDAVIRKNLAERLPLLGKIDEINKTPMPGIFEVRVGSELLYSDAEGNYIFQGSLIDAKRQRNLTEERQEKLLAIDFSQLPLNDAFVIVRGNGKRKIAIFEDPNCGYCKRFERDLVKIDNVTVYMFMYPILGHDSALKARNFWCAKDKGKTWLDWMVRDVQAPAADVNCDATAVVRNVEFGRKFKITGTPTMLLADGTRVAGAVGPAQVEKYLAEVKQ